MQWTNHWTVIRETQSVTVVVQWTKNWTVIRETQSVATVVQWTKHWTVSRETQSVAVVVQCTKHWTVTRETQAQPFSLNGVSSACLPAITQRSTFPLIFKGQENGIRWGGLDHPSIPFGWGGQGGVGMITQAYHLGGVGMITQAYHLGGVGMMGKVGWAGLTSSYCTK